MIKIDLNFDIKTPEGEVIENAGKSLSRLLMQKTDGDAIKLFDWAMKLHNKQPLLLDNSDINLLKEIVKNNNNLFVVAKAPILQAILDAKEEEK